jgi:hypothetical protein
MMLPLDELDGHEVESYDIPRGTPAMWERRHPSRHLRPPAALSP